MHCTVLRWTYTRVLLLMYCSTSCQCVVLTCAGTYGMHSEMSCLFRCIAAFSPSVCGPLFLSFHLPFQSHWSHLFLQRYDRKGGINNCKDLGKNVVVGNTFGGREKERFRRTDEETRALPGHPRETPFPINGESKLEANCWICRFFFSIFYEKNLHYDSSVQQNSPVM